MSREFHFQPWKNSRWNQTRLSAISNCFRVDNVFQTVILEIREINEVYPVIPNFYVEACTRFWYTDGKTECGGRVLQSWGNKDQRNEAQTPERGRAEHPREESSAEKEAQKSAGGPFVSLALLSYIFIMWKSLGQAKNHQAKSSHRGPVGWTTIKILRAGRSVHKIWTITEPYRGELIQLPENSMP